MPTIRYTRTWCSSCKDFVLHYKPFNGEFQCKECGNTEAEYKMSEIPEEKIKEQIKRWKLSEDSNVGRVISRMLTPTNPFYERKEMDIVEDSCGYEAIVKAKNDRDIADRAKKIKEQNDLKLKYAGLTRNDKCGCGSGLKFKNCCLPKINEIIYF